MDIINKTEKKIFLFQSIQTLFVIVILVIAALQLNGIIVSNTGFYVISIFAYSIIIFTDFFFYILKLSKIKNNTKNIKNKLTFNMFIIMIELFIVGIICALINHRIDTIEFTSHPYGKTEAYIYEIETDRDYFTTYENGKSKQEIRYKFTYNFYYTVDEIKYYQKFSETRNSVHSPYDEGDTFFIYYSIDNPNNWRNNIGYLSENVLYVFEIIVIVFQLYWLTKTGKEYDKIGLNTTE